MKRKNILEFINAAICVHDDKYDYSKSIYKKSTEKICIICPTHGEFWQTPHNHLHGNGCPKCGNIKKKEKESFTSSEFILKAKAIHGDKYNYSKVEYVNSKTKVCIICPKHGEFWQVPSMHLSNNGCPKCAILKRNDKQRINTDVFIHRAIKVHGNKYDYSKVKYVNAKTKVCIICSEHGEFWQTPSAHLSGQGCPKCGGSLKLTNLDFIQKASSKHNNKYDYSNVEYINNRAKIKINCPIHGEFTQTPNDHLLGKGCPKCGQIFSKSEDDIISLLQDIDVIHNERTILKGKEIDIYIPSLKIGIEYNGLRWHSEEFGKDRNYHLNKLNECNKQGIKLIQIFEDEWINHREICESKLKQICGLNNNPKLFARKCTIREINNVEAKEFLNNNHIQGFVRSSVYLGCFYNDKLVGVMSFKKEKDGYWDLNRFATDINYQCVGIGGKLFKYFITHYDFKEIKSFADRRWTTDPTNNLYTKLGFKFDSFTKTDYKYYNGKLFKRNHKFSFRKQILHKKYGLPLTMTESEMVSELGYHRIWDCGLIKYVYEK